MVKHFIKQFYNYNNNFCMVNNYYNNNNKVPSDKTISD